MMMGLILRLILNENKTDDDTADNTDTDSVGGSVTAANEREEGLRDQGDEN